MNDTVQDIFGNAVEKDLLLRDRFIEPPFSVLDTKLGPWLNRKRMWISRGIESEVGREDNLINYSNTLLKRMPTNKGSSIFDPVLCEIMYHWFCNPNGKILDPFAGGSVRGVVAHYLEYDYTGIELRQEQVNNNKEQASKILKPDNQPNWVVGDSNVVLDDMTDTYDFVFSCPPYAYLEKYSELPGDISNMTYEDFLVAYKSIINKSCKLLKPGGYACFVVGEVRDRKGKYLGFVPDTIESFQEANMAYYNEAILLTSMGTAAMRAPRQFKASEKVVKIHQNILVFKKPE